MVLQPPELDIRTNTVAKEFHLQEFQALRTEHDALDARLVTITQYLLLFSAAIYSFLLNQKTTTLFSQTTATDVESMAYVMLWFVPTIAGAIGVIVLYTIASKIKYIDEYIRGLETYLRFSQDLGWEHFRVRKFPAMRMAYIGMVIFVLNLAAGVMGSRVIGSGAPLSAAILE